MTTSITAYVTRFEPTTAIGSNCRGNRTCLTRFACPMMLALAIWIEPEKKIQIVSPERMNSG